MIENRMLHHTFDEEEKGFGAPAIAGPVKIPSTARGALVLMALAGLSMVLSVSLGAWRGWPALVTGPLLLSAATAYYFWKKYQVQPEGIRHDRMFFEGITSRKAAGWLLGVAITGFYVLLYWFPARLEGVIRMMDPLAHALSGQDANQWFLYGTAYTLAVLVFGTRMLMKYRHNRYQQIRTVSVMFFQLGFAFLLPNVLKAFHQPEFYFTYFWPLKPEYMWPAGSGMGWILDSGRLGAFMILWGAVLSFVATPVLTYFYGKRWYCSWVCGCGGLAETLGDPFRQLSNKSTRAWRLERVIIYSVLGLVVLTTLLLWIDHLRGGAVFGGASQGMRKWYGFYIGAIFSGVVGVGFYPILGNRVWCRFGCPMAAVLGIWQRLWSRFRITTNGGQCMSCGNCSTYCEMGIDVRAYAQRGENIVRASCVGCGVCAAVCPRGVLKLENGDDPADRYPGAHRPLDALLDAMRSPVQQGHYASPKTPDGNSAGSTSPRS